MQMVADEGRASMAQNSPNESSPLSASEPRDPKEGAADTATQEADTARHVSDVVLADSATHMSDVVLADSVRHKSDVVLADPTARKSDVVLADSASPKEISEVAMIDSATIRAPTFRQPAKPFEMPSAAAPTVQLKHDGGPTRGGAPEVMEPGAQIDDFEVVRLLGQGAFGHVYLARQITLDRLVALKVSANRGSEGRTMARLEHQHIVQVFSEKVDIALNQRLLCMQLVPGIGLEKLISMLHSKAARAARTSPDWTGEELIGFIDKSDSLPTALDPAALHDREALQEMDAVEATAWFGARLAEALDFAHRNGVLHRDIKPANILVNPYGRPMLADFNISSQPVGSEASGEEMFGGTFAYMSPEHLDAFNPGDDTRHEAVTAQSDLYSLVLVLQQLLEGRIAFPLFSKKGSLVETLKAMAADRRVMAPVCNRGLPRARMTLERTIGRCLEAEPADRFASGAELAAQLDGCCRLREAQRQLPIVPRIFSPILRHPFIWLMVLVVFPQLVASAVNIAYNLSQIVAKMSDAQQQMFFRVLNIYNVIVYPAAILAFVLTVVPIARTWKALSNAEKLPDGQVRATRQQALRIPRFIAILTAIGWFPGGVLFPFIIWENLGLEMALARHFVVSFVLSGMIALAYSLCGVEFIVLRGLYPGLWRDARRFSSVARDELAPVQFHLTLIRVLAYLIPLVAALGLLLFIWENDFGFRLLVSGMILLGIVGSIVTGAITRHLSRVIIALTRKG